ncbi:MAG: thioredoxin domain-containing protein [Acidobacteriaceae bacterium]|nr:thioredoxin domain-containing protein [Acidobacteriaceae bacterium]
MAARSEKEQHRLRNPVEEMDHVLGPATAPITLVEYGDFASAACGQADHVVKELLRWYRNLLRFVFRYCPDVNRPQAWLAAEAAEAAAAQGAFWGMHECLFNYQQRLDEPSLLQYAIRLSLHPQRFREDLKTHRYRWRVQHDLDRAHADSVGQSPVFFINGFRYTGESDLDDLLEAIDASLK